jgi:hypothetical protein
MVTKPGDLFYSLSPRFGGRGLGGQNHRMQFSNRTLLGFIPLRTQMVAQAFQPVQAQAKVCGYQ